MKDKEKLKQDSQQEYLRDKMLVDAEIDRIRQEDMNFINDLNRKKEVAKSYMYHAYEEKTEKKKQQKEVLL